MPGRKIIILIVVITSSLSFSLGYFVGKSVSNELPSSTQIITPAPTPETEPQQEKSPAVREQALQDNQPQSASVPQQIEMEKEQKASEPKTKTSEPKSEPKKEIIPQAAVIYTVQVGAFKSSADAEELENTLKKKGYEAYIKQSTARNSKVFKVRTGEFASKKDAEVLAIKLKNKDGLKAFVTFKNEGMHEKDNVPYHAPKQEKPR
ncbi:MAG: SPOR domain-containing protein [Nitrospirae bacterium]|nr:SPOR domain-containing protein [Nitrospirota bacterium]